MKVQINIRREESCLAFTFTPETSEETRILERLKNYITATQKNPWRPAVMVMDNKSPSSEDENKFNFLLQ